MRKKKGFTLIELMIVIAIIAILAQVLIPNLSSVRKQMKNNSVGANVYLVRSFLENRSGKDVNTILTYISNHPTDTNAIATALTQVKDNIGTSMAAEFTNSNKVVNPFNSSSTIYSNQGDITLYGSTASSILVGYNNTSSLPISETIASASLPGGTNLIGDVVVVIYQTGYVTYGVEDGGNKVNLTIIKMPKGLNIASIVTPTTGVPGGTVTPPITTQVLANIDRVYNFLVIDGAKNIINSYSTMGVYSALQASLSANLYNYFNAPSNNPASNSYNAIVNPVLTTNDLVIQNNNDIALSSKYSVIACQEQSYGTNDYSAYKGAVVVYPITTSPYGYDIYGIDQSGNKIGEKKITLDSLINATTESTLSNNVKAVATYLQTRVASDKTACKTDYYNYVYGTFYPQMQSYSAANNIKNAYVNSWTGVKYTDGDTTFYSNIALIVARGITGFSLYKGTVIVNAILGSNNTLDGYEVYGYNYNGVTIGYIKIP